MADERRSLARQLRELHQALDADAPRFMTLADRKSAIAQHFTQQNGVSSDGKTASHGRATDGASAGPRSSRREAHGISLPGAATPGAAGNTSSHSGARRNASSGERNIDRLVRFLFEPIGGGGNSSNANGGSGGTAAS